MTGVEWILLLIGSIFMIGSFFIAEKLSPSELNKIAELSESEIGKIINRGLEKAEACIEETIDGQIEASVDKVDRALEKETNDKIMAISEYSDTVVESMNKTHNEIMFLYSMLNDKHAELTGMTSDLQRLAADVRSLEENLPKAAPKPVVQAIPTPTPMPTQASGIRSVTRQKTSPVVAQTKTENAAEEVTVKPKQPEQPKETKVQSEKERVNKEVLALHKEGMTELEIARKLKMGVGEVKLIIGLYRGE